MDHDILATLDPRELGRRLQEARRGRGYTQQEVADHLNVARTTITAIEKGERRVQPTELVRLAALYGRSLGGLLRKSEPTESFTVQLRAALAPNTPIESELTPYILEFQQLCEDYLELERINHSPLPRNYPPPYQLEGVAPELVAEDVATAERNRLGLGDGPLVNLRELLENDVGLRIFYVRLPSQVAALFAYTESLGGCIAINSNHPEERRRLSDAHEYGHFLTKRYKPEVVIVKRIRRQPGPERFADAFARAFLMPATGLARRFNEVRRSRQEGVTVADLCTLAHLYFVSVQALTLRLEELRQIPSGTWDRLRERGFRVREAQELLHLPERATADQPLPTRYQFLAVAAFLRGDLSEGQLARFLRSNRLEARRMVDEMASRIEVSDDGSIESLPLDLNEPLQASRG